MKWGNTKLNILLDSYIPPYCEAPVNIITLLPGVDNTESNTVIQGGGRGRWRTEFDGFVESYSELQSLITDYINKVPRIFTGADGFSKSMIIFEFESTERTLFPLRLYYSITLVEV